jgi:hypothetical protein
MTSLPEKIQSIEDQGLEKIAAMLRLISLENEALTKKLAGTKEEKKAAREELLSFADLFAKEVGKLSLELKKSPEEIIAQVVKQSNFTSYELEKITAFNRLVLYCQQTAFQEPDSKKKKIKKFKA